MLSITQPREIAFLPGTAAKGLGTASLRAEVMFAALLFPIYLSYVSWRERSKDLRHYFLIGTPKLPFSNPFFFLPHV